MTQGTKENGTCLNSEVFSSKVSRENIAHRLSVGGRTSGVEMDRALARGYVRREVDEQMYM